MEIKGDDLSREDEGW